MYNGSQEKSVNVFNLVKLFTSKEAKHKEVWTDNLETRCGLYRVARQSKIIY